MAQVRDDLPIAHSTRSQSLYRNLQSSAHHPQAANYRQNLGVRDRVEFVVADAERLVFRESHYHIIWTMEASEHFQNRREYFKNAANALRPQGKLLVAAGPRPVRQSSDSFCQISAGARQKRSVGARKCHRQILPRTKKSDYCSEPGPEKAEHGRK